MLRMYVGCREWTWNAEDESGMWNMQWYAEDGTGMQRMEIMELEYGKGRDVSGMWRMNLGCGGWSGIIRRWPSL